MSSAGPSDGGRDVTLRVPHLSGRRGRKLEADEVVEEDGRDRDERSPGGREVAEAEAVDAVLERVEAHGRREEREEDDLRCGSARRHALPLRERRDRHRDRRPDEAEREDVAPDPLERREELTEHGQAR